MQSRWPGGVGSKDDWSGIDGKNKWLLFKKRTYEYGSATVLGKEMAY